MAQKIGTTRLAHFKIRPPEEGTSFDKVNVDDQGQYEIIIEVVKEAQGKNGVWQPVKLTAQERNSLTVAEMSADDDQVLAPDWTCHEQRGAYDPDLGTDDYLDDMKSPLCERNPQIEYLRRYVHCTPTALIARMILGGQTYTTYCFVGVIGSNFRAVVESVRPFVRLHNYEKAVDTKLSTFNILFPGRQTSSSELYANDRHQCKVIVEVVVEEKSADGVWVERSLTPQERESATITAYSADKQAVLPRGYSVDKDKNIYDSGLRRLDTESPAAGGYDYRSTDPRTEVIDRYLRFAPGVPIEPSSFMARIIVGGQTFTTYGRIGNPSITMTPTRPYVLRVRDLNAFRVDALNPGGHYDADLDVYYWVPKDGTKFLVNRGLDAPLPIPNEGRRVQSYYAHNGGSGIDRSRKVAVLLGDRVNDLVRMGDIQDDDIVNRNTLVNVASHDTIMRAVRLSRKFLPLGAGKRRPLWRLWCMFGCEHAFYVDESDYGNVIHITDHS
ncbi:hypothetical protein C4J98_0973 [Pseudomonas orientalis]|uniref:hypothetical protein n=1 Tax=Pseudomonas orientalis TaxID=76758 RepID=UPI000F575CF3|nr:hypothetical protein [Pseudomonas orientalis]AZE82402.1 hypothetical protein C4J98_0973 [Pseudomonas orientalis]